MTHTAHIAKFYYEQWLRSGGTYDENGSADPKQGNVNWFHKYWRESEVCYHDAMAEHRRPWH
jgi:hypothetical protein